MKNRNIFKTLAITLVLLLVCSLLLFGCDKNNDPDNSTDNTKTDLLRIITSLEELNALSAQYKFEVDEKYNDEFFESNVVVADFFTATIYNEIFDVELAITNNKLIITRNFDYANGVASTALRSWNFLHEISAAEADNIQTIETRNIFVCKENIEKYHAKLYIPQKNWFKKEFLENNLTGGMIVEGEPDEYGIPTVDQIPNTYPKKRNYIINNKEEFDSIFSSFAAEIDFDAQMLVLLIETSINPNPDYIKALTIDNKLLNIYCGLSLYDNLGPGEYPDNASSPKQKYKVVVLDKISIENFTFL